MNKQLINKYKPEFDHWLNEGSLLMSNKNTKVWITLTNNTWTCTAPSVDHLLIVINDGYVEFRKALAEGKTIEYFGQTSNVWSELPEPNFVLHPTCYRIKPDEPKFKVGDFVRYVHSTPAKALEINNINGNRYYFTNSEMSCVEHELEPWTPVKDEWCWFYDNPNKDKYCNLSKSGGESNGRCFKTNCGTPWNFCEPFLNSLPSYLKDK